MTKTETMFTLRREYGIKINNNNNNNNNNN